MQRGFAFSLSMIVPSLVLAQYQHRFKFILVDEYQDTNVAQYLWLRLIAQRPATGTAAVCTGASSRTGQQFAPPPQAAPVSNSRLPAARPVQQVAPAPQAAPPVRAPAASPPPPQFAAPP
jgi:DNA helicase-2/ATP-dependent DNA helicase PcrA